MKRLLLVFVFILTAFTLFSCGHEHSFGEWETVTDSTCTSEGVKKRVCECGETESASVEKKNHTVCEIAEIKATCTIAGYTRGTYCSQCGNHIEAPAKIDPAHEFVSNVANPPTCLSKGTNLYTCIKCNSTYTESVSELGHSFVNATCTSPKRCTRCFSTEGVALGHTTAFGNCTRCNTLVYPSVVLPALPLNSTNNVVFCKTVFTITDIDYRFTKDSLIITFAGEKTSDSGTIENGKYFCGFSYRLYDKDGSLIKSDRYAINNLAVGDRISGRTITVELPEILSDTYVLVIDNY